MRGRLRFPFRSLAAAVVAMVGTSAPAFAASLPRIVSMNVCTDQLLLPLADPAQILGLSRFSREAWVGGDDPEALAENRRLLADDFAPDDFVAYLDGGIGIGDVDHRVV